MRENKSTKLDMSDFVDNQEGNTMAVALRRAFGDIAIAGDDKSGRSTPEEVRVATAFLSLAGFNMISSGLNSVGRVRLMFGVGFPVEASIKVRRLGQSAESKKDELLQKGIKFLHNSLVVERNHLPFNVETSKAMRSIVKITRKNMEVRCYEKSFLHAKAYICTVGNSTEGNDNNDNTLLVGSSNLTSAGLTSNLELNINHHDRPMVDRAVSWFDELWEEAKPFDLATVYEEVLKLQDPWLIFLRVLYELYGNELESESEESSDLQLTTFQKHGVARVLRLIKQHGGAIVADEVGLGKTFIAGDVLKRYYQKGQRSLLVCPAALRDSTWKNFLHDNRLYCECYSYHELANDARLNKNTNQQLQNHIRYPKDDYQLIIIDEAHNYRNPSALRTRVLRELLSGRPKEVLLLTATPVNNTLWDLYTLLDLFIRQDGMFADQGILSMRQRFIDAAGSDPLALNPDMLYPIIDATTVKRTRQFVKRHYSNDTIVFGGEKLTITFPEPKPITIRYDLESSSPGLAEAVFSALDPDSENNLYFARYRVGSYLNNPDDEEVQTSIAGVGLLRTGLLKRFESSSHAFNVTLKRIQKQYKTCIDSLERGFVPTSKFYKEFSAEELPSDDESLEELLSHSEHALSCDNFDIDTLKNDLQHDLLIIDGLIKSIAAVDTNRDAKLKALRDELEKIVSQAEKEAADPTEACNKRKVLIFSFYADTVKWIYEWLVKEVKNDPRLSVLQGRIAMVAGSDAQSEEEEMNRDKAVIGFAPQSMRSPDSEDLYDVLISTDVLAEGVDLQQCRHIINYDLPWNPMRLVQRHGRIDRIGSKHKRVYLRSIFPDAQLDELLKLYQRILDKIALAAATVGVQKPVEGAASASRVFSESRKDLDRIIAEDASFYEQGGSASAAQTGEEYRQILREALANKGLSNKIQDLPWRAGSGIRKGEDRGVFFCARIGESFHLCFVYADDDWHPRTGNDENKGIEGEIGKCLRLIEVEEHTEIHSPIPTERVHVFWERAMDYFYDKWQFRTDPKNLRQKVKKINRQIIEFLEKAPEGIVRDENLNKALELLEGVWSSQFERHLRSEFNKEHASQNDKIKSVVDWITNESGQRPYEQPKPLDPILREDIKLLCWMMVDTEE